MKIFDAHTHGYSIGRSYTESADYQPISWVDKIRAILDGGEVSGTLCCSDLSTSHAFFERNNKDLLDLATQYGSNRLQIAAMIHPNKPDWKEHAARWFDAYPQLTAIKLKTERTNCPMTPDWIDPIFEFAMERDRVVVAHTQPDPGYSSIAFSPSLKKHPRVKLVLYHASLNEEAAYLAACYPNVYVEPSWLGMNANLFSIMKKLGGYKKLIAGTDGPGWFSSFDGSPYADLINIVRPWLPDEDALNAYLYGNAARLFNLDMKD